MKGPQQTAAEVLENEFLEVRAKILELAAALDRLERAEGDVGGDERVERIRQAVGELARAGTERAKEIQLIFSLPYDEDWRRKLLGS